MHDNEKLVSEAKSSNESPTSGTAEYIKKSVSWFENMAKVKKRSTFLHSEGSLSNGLQTLFQATPIETKI